MGIYNNVACIFLSEDSNGEVWVHFGVELRGTDHAPHLSTFGGAIDVKDGEHENPITALQREIHEEVLGLLDDSLSTDTLTTPEKTYSFAYTSAGDMTSTIVCATTIDHTKMLSIKENFQAERKQRMYQEDGKCFQTRAETEVKDIRSVPLTELKFFLEQLKVDEASQLSCADEASSFLSLDRASIKIDETGKLDNYQVWHQSGEPVETNIPIQLPMRPEIAKSLNKVMPGLEYRFFDKPIITEEDMSKGFYGKSLRADEFCYFSDFLDTCPIKGLTTLERKTARRRGKRKALTARGTEIVDLKLREQYGLCKQYTEAQKENYSGAQSLSYFSVQDGSPVFGFSKERGTRLLGVANFDLLPNRIFMYDGGTVSRPYDGHNKTALHDYIKSRAFVPNATSYDVSEIARFKDKISSTGNTKWNEILGRISWDPEKSSICVYSDNQETRWIAISWANKVQDKIKHESNVLYDKSQITQAEFTALQGIKPKISFYNADSRKAGYYSQESIATDIQKANELYDDKDSRDILLSDESYEFLLMIDDPDKLEEILSNQILMKNILGKRLFIAEELIEKHHKLTGVNFELEDLDNLTFSNVTRSLLEKISSGMIKGFPTTEDERFKLHNLHFINADLSGMDLSSFDFTDSHFEKCALKEVEFTIAGEERLHFTDCDFRRTDTHHIDFSNSIIDGYFICDDVNPNFQILDKITNRDEYYENFELASNLDSLKQLNKPSDQLIQFNFELALYEKNGEAVTFLCDQYKVIDKLEIDDPTFIFMAAASTGNTKLMQDLMRKFPDFKVDSIDDDGRTMLFHAALRSQKEMLSFLLAKGANINAKDNQEENALVYAIQSTNPSIIEILVDAGIDINHISKYNFPAIWNAANWKLEAMCLKLLEQNVDPTNDCEYGETIFIMSAKFGSEILIRKLVEKGCDINKAVKIEGTTALMAASHSGNEIAAKVLLEMGADVNAVQKYGETALDFALKEGHDELFNLLLTKANQESINKAYITAASIGRADVMLQLQEKGASLKGKDDFNRNALDQAAGKGQIDIVKLLFEQADQDEINMAFVNAAISGNEAIFQLLLEKVSSVNVTDHYHRTALMNAARFGHKRLVEILLSKGADINIESFSTTALNNAAELGHHLIYDMLIEAGANIPQNSTLATTFNKAVDKGHLLIIKRLLPHVSEEALQQDLNVLAKTEHENILHYILQNYPALDLEIPDSIFGRTSVMIAAQYRRLESVKALCEAGANINTADKRGDTVLIFACQRNNIELVRVLLSYGADTSITNKKGESALSIAQGEQSEEIIALIDQYQFNDAVKTEHAERTKAHRQQVLEVLKERLILLPIDEVGEKLIKSINSSDDDIFDLILEAAPEACLYELQDISNKGLNILCYAIDKGKIDYVKRILNALPTSALQIIKDNDFDSGHNPLTFAIKKKQLDIAMHIVKKVPKAATHVINSGLSEGYNALNLAIECNNDALAYFILANVPASASHIITHGHNKGHNALTYAISKGDEKLAIHLFEVNPNSALHIITDDFMGKGKNALTFAIENKLENLAFSILGKFPDSATHVTTEGYEQGITPLHKAIEKGMSKLIEPILNAGADINAKYNHGHTPLMLAAAIKKTDCVEKLLLADSDLNAENDNHQTALTVAKKAGCQPIIDILHKALGVPLIPLSGSQTETEATELSRQKLLFSSGSSDAPTQTDTKFTKIEFVDFQENFLKTDSLATAEEISVFSDKASFFTNDGNTRAIVIDMETSIITEKDHDKPCAISLYCKDRADLEKITGDINETLSLIDDISVIPAKEGEACYTVAGSDMAVLALTGILQQKEIITEEMLADIMEVVFAAAMPKLGL